MKCLRYLPLTFICGVHGFAILAPYLAVWVAVLPFLTRRRMAQVAFAAA